MKLRLGIYSILLFLLTSCINDNRATIFSIGDSRESVLNTIASDFKVDGNKLSKEQVLERENGDHITLYGCVYKGQEYYKVRAYFEYEKVRKMEIKIKKDKYQNLFSDLESKYGLPHKIRPFSYSNDEYTVFVEKKTAVVVMDYDDKWKILLISGRDRDQLEHYLK